MKKRRDLVKRRPAAQGVAVLMTDAARLAKPEQAMDRLPPGGIVILRDYHAEDRPKLADWYRRQTRIRGLRLLIAGDPQLARRADGLHVPRWIRGRGWQRFPGLVTASAHSMSEIARAHFADFILLSPIFATASHKGAAALGPHRMARLIRPRRWRSGRTKFVALGGIDSRTSRRLPPAIAGIAAISAWAKPGT